MDKIGSAVAVHIPREEVCPRPDCGKLLHVYQTRSKSLITLVWGKETIREVWRYCPTHIEEKFGLAGRELLAPHKGTYGYDVMLKTALLRFDEGLRLQQIREVFQAATGAAIPLRTLCDLANRALSMMVGIHRKGGTAIKKVIDGQGGYILHIDGTFEEKPPLLLVAKEGVSGITLDAELLSSESGNSMRPVLERIKQEYGTPMAIVRDGGEGIRKAAETVFPATPQVLCQYHALKNVGEALFDGLYAEFVSGIEKLRVIPSIGRLCRSLRTVVDALPALPQRCRQILYDKVLPRMDMRELLPLATYAIGSWVVETKRKAERSPYPFSLPFLEMYKCCKVVLTKVHALVQTLACGFRHDEILCDLETVLKRVVQNPDLASQASLLERLSDVFQRIRTAFRVSRNVDILKHDPRWGREVVEKSREKLERYLEELTRSTSTLDRISIRRRKCEKVVQMLRRDLDELFVPNPIVEVDRSFIEYKLPRTNNTLERQFWETKRTLTRLKSRTRIKDALHLYGRGLALMSNLKNETYMRAVCPDGILIRFAGEGMPSEEASTLVACPSHISPPARMSIQHVAHFVDRSLAIVQHALGMPSEPPPPLPMPATSANGLLPP